MIKNYHHIKKLLLILIVLLLTLFGIVTFYTEKNSIEVEMDKRNTILKENIHKTFNVLLDDLRIITSKRIHAMLASNNHIIVEKFAKKDREGLYKLAKAEYDLIKLSNPYLKIMTFRLNDNSAFLRVHKPKMYGDTLNTKRTIIIDTNHSKKEHFGFEVGKLKMTYRVVIPIFYKNKHIGLIEVGIEPEYIMQKIDKIYNVKNALLIKKEMESISIHLKKEKLQLLQNNYYLVKGDELFKKHLKDIILNNEDHYIVDNNQEYYIDSSLNLYNHKKEVIAKLLWAYDITEVFKDLNNLLFTNIIKFMLLALIILMILNFSFNYFIKKILLKTQKEQDTNQRLKQLTQNLQLMIKEEVEYNRQKDKILLQQSKQAQMGEMINMIAHQWRQPLNAISASAIQLSMKNEMEIITSNDITDTTLFIENMTQEMSNTINDFMNFTKPSNEKEHIEIKQIINNILHLMGAQLKNHNINLSIDIEKKLTLYTYKKDLEHVLINIISNARDAFEEKEIKDKKILIKAYIKDLHCIIKITDNAGGIGSDIIDRLFDPYFTTKEQGKGTGLGLYMSKKILRENLNGDIYVENIHNGAEFTIELEGCVHE